MTGSDWMLLGHQISFFIQTSAQLSPAPGSRSVSSVWDLPNSPSNADFNRECLPRLYLVVRHSSLHLDASLLSVILHYFINIRVKGAWCWARVTPVLHMLRRWEAPEREERGGRPGPESWLSVGNWLVTWVCRAVWRPDNNQGHQKHGGELLNFF